MANVSQLPCPASRLECFVKRLTVILPLCVLLAIPALGQNFFPLSDVRPGMRGTGRTVFKNSQIENFQVEILGILENLTPRQSIILARLSGGPLAETGVMQGMSGSPVYIDGRLAGAIALGFPFSKEPIAGIQPIGQMIADVNSFQRHADARLFSPPLQSATFDRRRDGNLRALTSSFGSLKEIFTPLALSGFSGKTIETFAAQFRKFGLEPQQGVGGSAPSSQMNPRLASSKVPPPGSVLPGSMISVQLLSGDMTISADGTVTHVAGNKVFAFGHRFLDSGETDLPFARADVVALLPALNTSFKLSAARETIGSITTDLSTAIAGEIGRQARVIPLTIDVGGAGPDTHRYQLKVVNDRLLTSFITQTALFATLDATERTLGAGTLRLRGRIEFEGANPPVTIRDIFVSDTGVALQATNDAVATLAFILGSNFPTLRVKSLRYEMEPLERKRQLRIAQAWASRHEVRPGDSINVTVLLQGDAGLELTRTGTYNVPIGAPAGPLNLTVSDALTLNIPDFAGMTTTAFHTPEAMISALNKYRSSNAAYVRVWRQEPSFSLSGPSPDGDLTDPPPSVALILADPSASSSGSTASSTIRGSSLKELRLPVDQYVITGAKTIQVEIKD